MNARFTHNQQHESGQVSIAKPPPQAAFPSFSKNLDPQNYQHEPTQSTYSTSHAQGPQSLNNPLRDGRVLILCFDGIGNKFGENSNVVRLFRALKKGSQRHQVLYYQPGIGAYNKRAFITHTASAISSMVDSAVGRHVDDHVKDGYKFLIQNYMPGDKICLFGFSRGAYIARVLACMIYKVGILPRENLQQVDFAFNIYLTTGYHGYNFGREFKLTFASHVDIEFVGVWDSISSVGVIPKLHPYTSINYGVKCFRHALALDERRVRFHPDMWAEQTLDHAQELDVDFPPTEQGGQSGRDEWQYEAPQRDHADVKEVWFAGTHSDVGGSSRLSYIPLRWMIKECILARTGIQFDIEYLRDDLDFDFDNLMEEMKARNMKPEDLGEAYRGIKEYAEESKQARAQTQSEPATANAFVSYNIHRRQIYNILDMIFSQLVRWWFWWILEIVPMLTTCQDLEGNWIRLRRANLGRGRYIPFSNDKIYVHDTVQLLIKHGYMPKARNWGTVEKSPMLEYVS